MDKKQKPPRVRIARPANRPYQLRYTDIETGREVRISIGTRDEAEADAQKKQLEAKLLLGIDTKPKRRKGGAAMDWEEFRERYSSIQLSSLRTKSAIDAESRLDIAERIVKPKRLSDMANAETLHDLQARLLAGEQGTRKRRAPQTARNYLVAVLAALNWAEYMGWLPSVPKVRKLKVSKLRQMKGRPLNSNEVDDMFASVAAVVGAEAAPSWEYLLRGTVASGLRLEELMHFHWSDNRYIVPRWVEGGYPILAIPANMQKNDTEESIPMLPWLEDLLQETPEAERFGWVFNPMSLQTRMGRRVKHQRPNAEWVGKVISKIGKSADIVVLADAGNGKPKYASCHDLRRTCAERLEAAGVPEREASRILRHASVETTRRHYAPGNVQGAAAIIREKLAEGFEVA